MARYTRMQVLGAMYETGLVPVFYHADPQVVLEVARACAEGGARLIEFTNRGDFTSESFVALEKTCAKEFPQLITGVGSVVDAATAAQYIGNGANFVVAPTFSTEVAKLCNRRKIPYTPGCGTLSEIAAAEELGAEIVKIFPGDSVGGPAFVKAVRAPCPWTSIMPTGGVDITEESLADWFEAGVACVGMGSKLITKELLAKQDYDGISENVRLTLDIIARVNRKLGNSMSASPSA